MCKTMGGWRLVVDASAHSSIKIPLIPSVVRHPSSHHLPRSLSRVLWKSPKKIASKIRSLNHTVEHRDTRRAWGAIGASCHQKRSDTSIPALYLFVGYHVGDDSSVGWSSRQMIMARWWMMCLLLVQLCVPFTGGSSGNHLLLEISM